MASGKTNSSPTKSQVQSINAAVSSTTNHPSCHSSAHQPNHGASTKPRVVQFGLPNQSRRLAAVHSVKPLVQNAKLLNQLPHLQKSVAPNQKSPSPQLSVWTSSLSSLWSKMTHSTTDLTLIWTEQPSLETTPSMEMLASKQLLSALCSLKLKKLEQCNLSCSEKDASDYKKKPVLLNITF